MGIGLEELGLDQEQLQSLVVDRICEKLLETITCDESGDEVTVSSSLAESLRKEVRERTDAAVAKAATIHFEPLLQTAITDMIFQETNRFGQAIGKPVTFLEYIAARSEQWLLEEVDVSGRSQAEVRAKGDSYWQGRTTRVLFLAGKLLSDHVGAEMEKAMKLANATIAGGLQKALEAKLAEVTAKLKG